jgi:hypothetical protein
VTENGDTISFEEFVQGLDKERELYAVMIQLASKQQGLLAKGDAEGAVALLEEKARLMEAFESLEGHLVVWKSEWRTRRESLSAKDRERAERALAEIEKTLQELLEKENEIQAALSGEKRRTVSDILQAQKGRQAGTAYLKPKKEDAPRFFDKKQ